MVDMTQLRDKGPEIAVVSEEGRRAPLSKVEERMDKHGGAANTSRSIFETVSLSLRTLNTLLYIRIRTVRMLR